MNLSPEQTTPPISQLIRLESNHGADLAPGHYRLTGPLSTEILENCYNAGEALLLVHASERSAPAISGAKRLGHRGATRFPGITEDARKLGVSRTTLFRALSGVWNLPGLVKRYTEMQGQKD